MEAKGRSVWSRVVSLEPGKSITNIPRFERRPRMIGRILDILTAKLVRVNGPSMEPTFPDGSWVVVNRRAFSWPGKPKRFDVVRFEDPSQRGRWLVKRVVGLPDEEVALRDGRLEVNGDAVQEPHLAGLADGLSGTHEWWPCTNEYVLLGDNRDASTDSRKFGTVPIGAFRGRVVRRVR